MTEFSDTWVWSEVENIYPGWKILNKPAVIESNSIPGCDVKIKMQKGDEIKEVTGMEVFQEYCRQPPSNHQHNTLNNKE